MSRSQISTFFLNHFSNFLVANSKANCRRVNGRDPDDKQSRQMPIKFLLQWEGVEIPKYSVPQCVCSHRILRIFNFLPPVLMSNLLAQLLL